MPKENINLAILFADISGSTSLYETLGDERAHKLVSNFIAVISDIISQYQGKIIKTIGDEVMCTFNSAYQAMNAAISMHKALDDMPPIHLKKPVKPSIRIGLHMGPVIWQKKDIFGDAVNVAARMVSLAKSRQIITTQQTIDELPEGASVEFKCIDKTSIKGKTCEFTIFEVVWEEHNQTMMVSKDLTLQILYSRMHLRYKGIDYYVDRDNPAITLGRHEQNDMEVNDVIASRIHARIEYHRGKFTLIDQSTNGTYVSVDGKKSTFIHHDEYVLTSHGIISLGRDVDDESPEIIRFTCEYQ
jgi:adenylate cyclase